MSGLLGSRVRFIVHKDIPNIAAFVISMLEWGVEAGWLIGALWWSFTNAQAKRRR